MSRVVHKFGRNAAVGTTFVPVAFGGVYQTPLAASATTLRVKAGNAFDTAAGIGAREVFLQGLDASGNEITETVATAGASASSATTQSFMRLYRAYVSASGTYATSAIGSHQGDIVIENGAGGTDWLTIDSTSFPKGQSEVAVYSIPNGKIGYIESALILTDSSKTTDILLFQRTNITQAAAPYDAMRLVFNVQTVGTSVSLLPQKTPIGPLVGPCDVGWMAKVGTGTATVAVDYEITLVNA